MRRLMRFRRGCEVLLACVLCLSSAATFARDRTGWCDQALANVPSRASFARTGSEFVRQIESMGETEREAAIEAELLSGDIPTFLTRLVPVEFAGMGVRVTLCVAPDYLAIGSDRDFLFVPMRLSTALRVAQRYDAVLPTARIVDAVYEQADLRLAPQPLPPTEKMRSTAYYREHNALVRQQREARGGRLGELTAGDKKDLVLTERLRQMSDRVAIYGWHRGKHDPIQPLSTVHGARYADYSHGVRLVATKAYVDGEPRSLLTLIGDPRLAPIVSSEGAIAQVPDLIAKLEVSPPESGVKTAGTASLR
jgi:hypothetical protein